jgi:hypothetical protein
MDPGILSKFMGTDGKPVDPELMQRMLHEWNTKGRIHPAPQGPMLPPQTNFTQRYNQQPPDMSILMATLRALFGK